MNAVNRRDKGWGLKQPPGALAWICLLSLATAGTASTGAPAELPLVRTPNNVHVNRTLPSFTPPSQAQPISDSPTDEEMGRLRVFPQRLVPVEKADSHGVMEGVKGLFSSKKQKVAQKQDNQDAATALRDVRSTSNPYDTALLEAFLQAHPDSRWAAAFRHELCRRQFRQGWFTQAAAGWDALWDDFKGRREPGAVDVANEGLSNLLDVYIGLAKADRLATLIGEQELRPGNPVIMAKILRARQAVWLLRHKGAQNVMCGPVALYCILRHNHQAFAPIRLNDITDDYIATGISLTQLKKYADSYKMGLVMARKPHGLPIPTPAVMHLASGHYSAIIGETNGTYALEDRPMQFQGQVSLEALDAQASGYFLIPAGRLPTGWSSVTETEGSQVFGRDGLHGQEPLSQSCTECSQMAGGSAADCCGMPVYMFHPQIASLRVEDSPIGYSPPVGPSVIPVIAYNDLDDSKPVGTPMFSNVGRMWSINWIAYVDFTVFSFCPNYAGAATGIHVPGGGLETVSGFGPNDRSFTTVDYTWYTPPPPALCSYVNGLIRTFPDGSQEIYGGGTSGSEFFLTKQIDPAGNAISFTYDSNMRLIAVTDAIGQVTTLEYNWPGDMWKVTKITDPFGRFATFSYNSNSNELSSVTDVIGLTTTFTYDTNEFLTSMTTPYGTTTFTNTRPVPPLISYDYSLTATDPEGNQEKVHYIEPIDIPPLGPPLPSSIAIRGTNVSFIAEDARLAFRNSFYWNKKAMKEGPNDFSVARNYRWLTDANYLITPILEAVKEPLENRVWFDYPGQVGGTVYASYPYYAGGGSQPEKTLRMLSDGSPQLTQTYYNAVGHLSEAVDPAGRTTIYNYASNLIDLVEIRQMTALNTTERVASFAYNNQHLPTIAVDAAGQTNAFSYNARGQLVSFVDPEGGITALSYDSNGYLLAIDGPLPGTNDTTTLSYDGFGRIRTVTGSDGYSLTFDYDNLDRLTAVTYPDGTFDQLIYNRLDLSVIRDRIGRQTQFTYNSLRQLVQVQDALNRVTRLGWCECGALSSIIDPMGRITSWQYDVQSRPVTKQYADGAKVAYHYDSASGRLKDVTDENGQEKLYDYYVDDQLKRISYLSAQVPTAPVAFGYDSNYNRVVLMQDGIGTTTWSYYPVGVLGALKVATVTGPWANATVNYQYDALRRLVSRNINGVAQSYRYDPLGRLTNVVNSLGSFSYAYDGATFRVRNVTYPSGQTSHYDYLGNLSDNRLQRITNAKPDTSLISSFTYAYDEVGNITNWLQEIGTQTLAWSITYDAADQLLSVVAAEGGTNVVSYGYGYDAAGNRLSENTNAGVRRFNFNALNQLVSSSDAAATNASYLWDPEGRLSALIQGDHRSDFAYDGLGRRVQIVESTNGTILDNSCFFWCGSEICEKRDSSGNSVRNRFYSQGEVALNGSPTNYFYTKDHLGSTREVTDVNANLISRLYYDPWGKESIVLGSFTPAFGFSGHFWHAPSRLGLAYYRCFDSSTATWLSRDPLGEAVGPNVYSYLGNNPVNDSDEFGLQADVNLTGKGSAAYNYAQKLQSPDDEVTVVIHGNPRGSAVSKKSLLPPEDLAKRIRNLGDKFKNAKRIRLISCRTGLGDYPQKLADLLNKQVLAPTTKVSLSSDGTYQLKGNGEWKPFTPDGPPLPPKQEVNIDLSGQ